MTDTNNTEEMLDNDVDALLDGTLDDLADIPEYKPFPAGAHSATLVSWEFKTFDDKKDSSKKNTAVEVLFRVSETVEPANPDDVVTPGQEVKFLFFLKHHSSDYAQEQGQGEFKGIMTSLAEQFGAKSNRLLMEDSKGAEVLLVTGHRKEKKPGTKVYSTLVNVKVV